MQKLAVSECARLEGGVILLGPGRQLAQLLAVQDCARDAACSVWGPLGPLKTFFITAADTGRSESEPVQICLDPALRAHRLASDVRRHDAHECAASV